MRLWASALFFSFVIAACFALPSQPTVDELKTRLQNARPEEKVGIALEIDERHRKLQATDAVRDRVVHLLEQRGAAVPQPVDERELPERPRPVERLLRERATQVEKRALVARRRKPAPRAHLGKVS